MTDDEFGIYPYADYVLVEPESKDYETEAGLYIPEETFTPEQRWALVLAVGAGVNEDLRAGDRVFCEGMHRRPYKHCWFVREEDIWMKEDT